MRCKPNQEVTCQSCGTTFRGACLTKLEGNLAPHYERVGDTLVAYVRCLCASRATEPSIPIVVADEPGIVVMTMATRFDRLYDTVRVVRLTPAFAFVVRTHGRDGKEVRLSRKTGTGGVYSMRKSELERGVLAYETQRTELARKLHGNT